MDVFQVPELRQDEREVLELIGSLQEQMSSIAESRRWVGSLRRMSFARAVQGSNSIEGYNASLDDVVAAVADEPTLDADQKTQLALTGYRDAMTYVLQIADDETLALDEGLLKSLHFMMLHHELRKNPGRWRLGEIFVRQDSSGEIVYQGPDADLLPELISAMLSQLREEDAPVHIKAAMAHLNLVMIHPFSDGNGRMARCLQTLVLAHDRILAPVFSSIEEFLGRNTETYYNVLAEVGAGAWNPHRDARPWVRFCLQAHYLQARTSVRRREEIEHLWNACAELAEAEGLAERCASGLIDAAYGFRIRRGGYKSGVEVSLAEEISDLTATRDLKAMVDRGLLEAVGERRARYYVGSHSLLELRAQIRAGRLPKAVEDPFEVVRHRRQLSLQESPEQVG
jgi:Fic family protein